MPLSPSILALLLALLPACAGSASPTAAPATSSPAVAAVTPAAAPLPTAAATTATTAPTAPTAPTPRLNIVLLLLDTVRPDHLGAYGYARPTSPNVDRFAATAALFERVWAHAPNTPRSFPSILASLPPSRVAFARRFANFSDVRPGGDTLFELFRAAGWRTEAVTSHWYFDLAPGVTAGVDAWDNRGALDIPGSSTQSAAPDITPRVVARLEALAAAGLPFLLFAHYFDPHGRYMDHPEVRTFGTEIPDKYDGEIAFTDHHLAPVFAALDRTPLRENTIVVVFSDHGEALGEHGLYLHGRALYEEEVRVPLLIRVPGATPRRLRDAAALIDLLPTLAALAGLPSPAAATGVSLAPLLEGRPGPALAPRTIFLEQLAYPAHPVHLAAAVGPTGTKVIYDLTADRREAYDLHADPGERTNLLAKDPAAARAEREALDRFLAELRP